MKRIAILIVVIAAVVAIAAPVAGAKPVEAGPCSRYEARPLPQRSTPAGRASPPESPSESPRSAAAPRSPRAGGPTPQARLGRARRCLRPRDGRDAAGADPPAPPPETAREGGRLDDGQRGEHAAEVAPEGVRIEAEQRIRVGEAPRVAGEERLVELDEEPVERDQHHQAERWRRARASGGSPPGGRARRPRRSGSRAPRSPRRRSRRARSRARAAPCRRARARRPCGRSRAR